MRLDSEVANAVGQPTASNQSHEVPTQSRPSRGAEHWEEGGSSATANAELERDKRGSPLDCRKSGGFFGVKGSGEGINPFLRNNENGGVDSESSKDISATPQYDKIKHTDSREIRCETNLQKALVTQRLHHHTPYNELWECLDSKLQGFLLECGIVGFGVSFTQIEHAEKLMQEADLLVLSGGNDIGAYPQRDSFETRLLECVLNQGKKVLGICRGAQMVASYFGARLAQSRHKIKEFHALEGSINKAGKPAHSVHSYHNFCIQNMPSGFEILAMAGGEIEAFCNEQILCFMWHPERESSFVIESRLITRFLAGENICKGEMQ